MVSSASRRPVGSRVALSSWMVTVAAWPAGTRTGVIWRWHCTRYRARPIASAESSGRSTSAPPRLSSSRWPRASPSTPTAIPAARKARPRVVTPANSDRIPVLPLLPSNLWPVSALKPMCRCRAGPAGAAGGPGTRLPELGQRDLPDDDGQHLLGQLAGEQGLRARQQPVGEHRQRQRLHVVGDHEVAAVEGSPGP